MEWFLFAAPVPGPVEFTVVGGATLAALLATVLTPVALVVRHAFAPRGAVAAAPQLRVIEGGKELGQAA